MSDIDFSQNYRANTANPKKLVDKLYKEFTKKFDEPEKYSLEDVHKAACRLRSACYSVVSVGDVYRDHLGQKAFNQKEV